jgi:hypothetical protein
MSARNKLRVGFTVLVALTMLTLAEPSARAHCDTLDGPVVKAARRALETGNLDFALIWIKKEAEPELTAAFKKTLEVRKLNGAARDLADTYFFETLVRLHRAGEGAPYTGLEPAGLDLGPAIPAADRAIQKGSSSEVVALLVDAIRGGLKQRFAAVLETRKYDTDDVAAGRKYVEAYVIFIHYVERLYLAATGPVAGHYPEGQGHTDEG